MSLSVVFWGNSNSTFSNRHFHALWHTPCDLVAVVDSPPSKRDSTNPIHKDLKNFRRFLNGSDIPIFEPESINSKAFTSEMTRLSPDVFIAVGYTNILKETILSVPHLLAVNFHASLLPAYRGKHPVFWCLRSGERWSGMTVHVMDTSIDTGDIIYQVRIRIRRSDTVSSLYARIIDHSLPLVYRLIEDCNTGALEYSPQPSDGASYYSSISDNDFHIQWTQEVDEIRRWIAITPGECFATVKRNRVYFMDAEVDKERYGYQPGQVAHIGERKGSVSVRNGSISFRQVKLENGKQLQFPELLHLLQIREADNLDE